MEPAGWGFMRVLLIPELYRPEQATANGTLNDAVVWVEQWLAIDETLHVYWLLPSRERANYDRKYVHADHDRVTLIEAPSFMAGDDREYAFTESGYSEAQLHAIESEIYDEYGYVDGVVDQLRRGRSELYKWLLLCSGRRPNEPAPFSIIVNVHDLLLPFKYRASSHRNEFQRRMEIAGAVFADGMWFKAGVDRNGMAEYGAQFVEPSVLESALERSVLTHSPIDFGRFTETYVDRPEWLHVAGSIWHKKHTEQVMAIASQLYERFGIQTLLTSMGTIPERYRNLPWVEAYPHASRETYEKALQRGDLTICASEYETLARTWFEQAASGQVLLLRDKPWIYDCVPADYGLVADVEDLADLAVWTVEHWADAVAENRRMVTHVRRVRNPVQAGRRTYDDLCRHVEATARSYPRPAALDAIDFTLSNLDTDQIALDELDRRAASVVPERRTNGEGANSPHFTPWKSFTTPRNQDARARSPTNGREHPRAAREQQRARGEPPRCGGGPQRHGGRHQPGANRLLTDRNSTSLSDLVFALRSLGYEDIGNPGTPVFRQI